MAEESRWDVLIIGGGPAGLSAALILGRCCRRVLVCDRGTPRNWAAKAMYGFISHDGMAPSDFDAQAHRELQRYPDVQFRESEVTGASREPDGTFVVKMGSHVVRARKLLIATGVMDLLPEIDGAAAMFGVSVFNCPYCDGWEYRGQPLAVYGRRLRGFEMARALTAWSRDIVLCTDGPAGFRRSERSGLERNGIRVIAEPIARLDGDGGRLSSIVFRDGSRIERSALFFDLPSRSQSPLSRQLGCRFNSRGGVSCARHQATSVPGVFVAGNIVRDVQLSVVAAAEGARAAFGINRALTREDFDGR